MATYYVDPAAAGANSGVDWANAWTGLKRAIDGTGGTKPVAGDLILCRGTEVVSTMILQNGNAGTATAPIRVRGVNSSGTDDGTKFTLNGNNNSLTAVMDMSGSADNWIYENILWTNCGGSGHGIRVQGYATQDNTNWINCGFTNNKGSGVFSGNSGLRYSRFIRCDFTGNTVDGVQLGTTDRTNEFYLCNFSSNTVNGVNLAPAGSGGNYSVFVSCQITGNGGRGVLLASVSIYPASLYGCVIDGNGSDGVETWGPSTLLAGCRITNNSNGVDANHSTLIGWTYMPSAGQSRANTTSQFEDTKYIEVTKNGTTTNNFSGTDANGGYSAPGSSNFTLLSTASLAASAVTLGSSTAYVSAGLSPNAGGSSGAFAQLNMRGGFVN